MKLCKCRGQQCVDELTNFERDDRYRLRTILVFEIPVAFEAERKQRTVESFTTLILRPLRQPSGYSALAAIFRL